MPFPYCWLHFSPVPALFGMMSTDGGLGPRSSFDCLLTICSSSLCHHLCLPRPPCKTCGSPLQPASSHPIPWHPSHCIPYHLTAIHPTASIPSYCIPSHCNPTHPAIPTPPSPPLHRPRPLPLSHSLSAPPQLRSSPTFCWGEGRRGGGSLEVSKELEII